MPPAIEITAAALEEAAVVAEILCEAARWLEEKGEPMWRQGELQPDAVAADVAAGQFFLARSAGEAAGTVKFQLEDALFWPDAPDPGAAYIHRLAVRRFFAGTGVSTAIFAWAAERTRGLGRRFLRLDCDALRPRLRAVYEAFGFAHHSDRRVGPYLVARYQYDVTKIPGAAPRTA